jgi:hypothetical protein
MNTRALLLALNANIPTETVVIKDVGNVKLKGLNCGQRDAWEQFIHNSKNGNDSVKNFRASLVCRCIVNEDGTRVYNDTAADLDEVSSLPAAVVDRLFIVCQKLSGLGNQVDELEKT